MEQGDARIFMVEAPVVAAADPFDPEGRTADLSWRRDIAPEPPVVHDPLVAGPGFGQWARRFGRVAGRHAAHLIPVMLLVALPMHFFVGRVDDTIVAAPALADLVGGFGLLLLPAMWLAYLAVSALPLVLSLAGAVGVALPAAAQGRRPRARRVWSLVSMRLRALWLWFAGFGLLTGGLPLLLTEEQVGAAGGLVAIGFAVGSTVALTFGGVLGCVVLIERGRGPRRAAHLLSHARPGGLLVAAAALTVVPRVADYALGGFAATAAGVVLVQLWAIAALVTYGQARRAVEPVTSRSLFAELDAPEE
ncbi:hypothetical protein Aab01nite_26230 [Paractinoplanes abujensis]|uniref:Uncharacterized protein n=1 Tax=Paractinoplanes abujensis TaxID=882441 RepID=A0A7W7G525_9ACTN|nr:hypothetical protein [Actinoplanes abujensis]MBB4696502.1 hypothetical protein [Actinoplanes abujensis]GID19033.1 hypothetical protein Aab01nite_26230 [Actinoplanes abujensis]